ncbi:hypothetical protein DFJ75_3073 [Williamsia muralis]|uniref:Uncharacterized protein n=1 Tax=Williamsia marianensis TaxID=85044 RepID=A0A495K4M5_WILMA|nr:hypothetical protein DFJ75_3073 [Williamsia muralis]
MPLLSWSKVGLTQVSFKYKKLNPLQCNSIEGGSVQSLLPAIRAIAAVLG